MREILFRGKRVDNGEWGYGNLITDGEDVFILVKEDLLKGLDVGGWIDGAQSYEVIPETVGQYTGLTDKNGKQIFEGDIVGAKHPEQKKAVPCLVKYGEYEDEDGRVDCRYLGFCLEVFDKCCSILTPLSDGIEYEVIGNVHDGGAYD